LHGYEAIDQPEQDTQDNQNHHYLYEWHTPLTPFFAGPYRCYGTKW
jgi:hypothetical protein